MWKITFEKRPFLVVRGTMAFAETVYAKELRNDPTAEAQWPAQR